MPRDGSVLVEPVRTEIRRQPVSRIKGFRHWRWHLDEILESYVTKKCDKSAALALQIPISRCFLACKACSWVLKSQRLALLSPARRSYCL